MDEITWRAPEFHYQEKHLEWYLFITVTVIAFFCFALWQQNLLFGIFLVIGALLIFHLANEQPRVHEFRITNAGIHVSDITTYKFPELEGFALEHTGSHASGFAIIRLQSRHRFWPYIHIFVPIEHVHDIQQALLRHIPQFEFEHTVTDALIHLFKL